MRRPRPPAAEDDGQILILALVFLLTVSFLVITPLALAWTNLSSSTSIRQQFKLQATAQSAMDLAIDQFRVHQDDGLPDSGLSHSPETCPLSGAQYDLTAPFVAGPPPTYTANGYTVSISCVGLVALDGTLGPVGRRVSFSVNCVPIPSQVTPCPSGGVLLGADVEYRDIPGQAISRNDTVRCTQAANSVCTDSSAVAGDVGKAVTLHGGAGPVPPGTSVLAVGGGAFTASSSIPANVTAVTISQAIVVQYWNSGY